MILFADEIYDKTLYDGETHTSIAALADDVLCVTFNGLSKNYRSCGYRAGWKTILGAFPPDVLEDNANPWSGDHCMDYTKVPGVLLSNRKIDAESPALTDIAPTILAEFGIAKTNEMKGQSVFGPH